MSETVPNKLVRITYQETKTVYFADRGEPVGENESYVEAFREQHPGAVLLKIERGIKPVEDGACA